MKNSTENIHTEDRVERVNKYTSFGHHGLLSE